jgi:hypothetical protein
MWRGFQVKNGAPKDFVPEEVKFEFTADHFISYHGDKREE